MFESSSIYEAVKFKEVPMHEIDWDGLDGTHWELVLRNENSPGIYCDWEDFSDYDWRCAFYRHVDNRWTFFEAILA
jgi:hypothetical protein